MTRYLLIPAFLLATACATTPVPQTAPAAEPATIETRPATRPVIIAARGLSCNSAIVIKATTEDGGIAEEHAWIQENYPGARVPVQQSLTKCGDKPVDQIEIDTTNGRKVTLYFDISNFFGKH